MKPARKGYWFLSALLLAGAVGAWLAGSADTPERRHLTRAEVRTEETVGFAAPPPVIAEPVADATWQAAELPHAPLPHHAQGSLTEANAAATRISWYRLALPELNRLSAPPYLYIPRWKSDGQIAIYGDGRLLYRSQANLQWNGSNRPLLIALNPAADPSPQTILIRIQHLAGIGGALSSLWVGSHAALVWRYLARDWLQAQIPFMSSAAFLAVGLFALFVWLAWRKESIYLLFFLMSLAAFARNLHDHVGLERLPIGDAWFGWLTVNSLFWLIAVTHLFLEQLHLRPQRWLTRTAFSVALACSILTLPLTGLPDATLAAPLVYVALLLLGNVAFAAGLWHSWKARSRNGMLLAGWCLVGIQFGVHDWLLQNNLLNIEGVFLGAYANVGAFFLFTYVMFRRYVDAKEEVERVNAGLEARLAQREAELTASHARLREIEQREMLGRERQRLMQDMHDGLGSSLRTALWVVEKGRLDEAAVADVLKGCIDDLKLAIDSMEPVQADLLLLLATWRFRLEPRLENTGIRLRWEVADVPALDWLDPKNALHILRILQETLANVLKHAGATEIRVTTSVEGNCVAVTVSDNGHGFDIAVAPTQGGKGLANQRRRAAAIGAEIRLASHADGTQMTLLLPISRRTEDARPTPP